MEPQVTDQAPTPSVEERAADILFGKQPLPKKAPPPTQASEEGEDVQAPEPEQTETDSETATEETQTGDDVFEFEADGVTYALPKQLEKHVVGSRELTQKSQHVAEQRRAFEVLNEQARVFNMGREFEANVSNELQQLQAYDSVLNQKVDWSQLSDADAMRTQLQRSQWKEEREAIARGLHLKRAQFEKEYGEAVNGLKAKAKEAVVKKIPNWSDATWNEIKAHAATDGYTDSELDAIADPRHQITLWKAQQYDSLKAKATKVPALVKGVKTSPSNPMPQHVKEKLAFNKRLSATAPGSQERKATVEARVGAMFSKRG
jgi:hypothetical protein